ncbi:hypothetical protein ACF0H5_019621 [Mactra antiquata]
MYWWSLFSLVVISFVQEVRCDYSCACVFQPEKSVLAASATESKALGYLFEYDCKPTYGNYLNGDNFIAIWFNHQIAYLEMDNYTEIRSCIGSPPLTDIGRPTTQNPTVSTQAPQITQTPTVSTQAPQITQNPTVSTQAPPITIIANTIPVDFSTLKPTSFTGSSVLQGHLELCSSRIQQLGSRFGTVVGQFGHSCYEFVDSGISWQHAQANCVRDGGHLVAIDEQAENDYIHTFLLNHHYRPVWIGLHDTDTEEYFTWASGNPASYTNWAANRYTSNHDTEDCVFMMPNSGEWDDVTCGINLPIAELLGSTHGYVCEFDTIDKSPDGDISLCSDAVRLHAIRTNTILAQNGNSCYEINKQRVTWSVADTTCTASGGHLVHVDSLDTQHFIQAFIKRHPPSNAVWIGLTDSASEGTFQWVSGHPVQFTNWKDAQQLGSTHVSTNNNDCAILVPYNNGQWEDKPCGHTSGGFLLGLILGGSTETHESICQYDIVAGTSQVGTTPAPASIVIG